jgi:hypothetical protein
MIHQDNEYIKYNFNEVNTLTAICRRNYIFKGECEYKKGIISPISEFCALQQLLCYQSLGIKNSIRCVSTYMKMVKSLNIHKTPDSGLHT